MPDVKYPRCKISGFRANQQYRQGHFRRSWWGIQLLRPIFRTLRDRGVSAVSVIRSPALSISSTKRRASSSSRSQTCRSLSATSTSSTSTGSSPSAQPGRARPVDARQATRRGAETVAKPRLFLLVRRVGAVPKSAPGVVHLVRSVTELGGIEPLAGPIHIELVVPDVEAAVVEIALELLAVHPG